MPASRRITAALLQGLAFGLLLSAPVATLGVSPALAADPAEVHLFRVVTMREDVVVGLTLVELTALGSGPEVERLARRIASEGQLTAWRYIAGRGPDGLLRLAARNRVAVLRQDALIIEPYAAALPVLAPPAE